MRERRSFGGGDKVKTRVVGGDPGLLATGTGCEVKGRHAGNVQISVPSTDIKEVGRSSYSGVKRMV